MKVKIKFEKINYFKENWGAPFIIIFMTLLIIAAVALTIGLEDIANQLAEYAYYSLVIGVILQIASYIKYERKQTHNNSIPKVKIMKLGKTSKQSHSRTYSSCSKTRED